MSVAHSMGQHSRFACHVSSHGKGQHSHDLQQPQGYLGLALIQLTANGQTHNPYGNVTVVTSITWIEPQLIINLTWWGDGCSCCDRILQKDFQTEIRVQNWRCWILGRVIHWSPLKMYGAKTVWASGLKNFINCCIIRALRTVCPKAKMINLEFSPPNYALYKLKWSLN